MKVSSSCNCNCNCSCSFIFRDRQPHFLVANSHSNSTVRFPFRAYSNNTLRVLEWDKLAHIVSSFASTPLGKLASMEQLLSVDQTYQESLRLLAQTSAAIHLINHDPRFFDFTRIHLLLVRTAINHASTNSSVDGLQALAIANLLHFAKSLQINLNDAIRASNDLRQRVKPVAELSLKLDRARRRVTSINDELHQLMNILVANEASTPTMEACKRYGRWCIRSEAGQSTRFKGLLVSSGAGEGNITEPVSAVPLNDKLQEAEASVAKEEAEVLLGITEKIKTGLDGIVKLLNSVVELDLVNARASYSLSVGGTCPDLILLKGKHDLSSSEGSSDDSSNFLHPNKKGQVLHLLQAYHPLLLKSHQHNLENARKDVVKSTSMGLELYCQFKRGKMRTENNAKQEFTQADPKVLQEKVTQLEKARPTPVDFIIDNAAKVVLISGPNMGGKTVCLKTLGLAAIMAKAGLYILCSEPARIPWFDHVLTDIGDQQSLSHSLSTFSGHLKQISDIQAKSTTHSDAFENACMEYDEVHLKPTFKILWGVPGCSKAINIAERLGMPEIIVSNARKVYGAASVEIDKVMFELEKSRQDVEEHVLKAHHYLRLSKDLHAKLKLAQKKLTEPLSKLNHRRMQQITDIASRARSTLHKTIR